MNITFHSARSIFWLETCHTTYAMHVDRFGRLIHLYYGATIAEDDDLEWMKLNNPRSFAPMPEETGAKPADAIFLAQTEYSACGNGDYHRTALRITGPDGCSVSKLVYQSHRIFSGKTPLPGLPQSHGEECLSLEIDLLDQFSGAVVTLRYSIFPDSDAIARSVRIVNPTEQCLYLDNAASLHLPFHHRNFELIYAASQYGEERRQKRTAIQEGVHEISSNRGVSGHQQNPSFILAEPGTTERAGEAYAVFLEYSGCFFSSIEVDECQTTRTMIGVNPENFRWQLKPGASFDTPEAVMVFSANGLSALSGQCHRFITEHVIRSPWKHRRRPILVNNWEGTYFDFNESKLLDIARSAADLGFDMLVLDDGWFGKRDDDTGGLGDWFVNTNKIPDFSGMIRKINDLGLKFGLWFEPEMINPASALYGAHPDWVLQVPGKPRSISRNQFVLDFSRPEIVNAIYQMMFDLLSKNNIEYIKWDCNRNLSEVFSTGFPAEQQGEIYHRYVLGVYALCERLLQAFPNLLIEGCSGGGGRFDAGMLYYAPQIWCSDDTDAVHRIPIQLGTSAIYPCAAMGAHVTGVPNHGTGQSTPLEFRGHIALAGTFGYELVPQRFTEEEKAIVRQQVQMYNRFNALVREGDFYRLTENFGKGDVAAWMWVSQDKKEALITAVRTYTEDYYQNAPVILRCMGLDLDYVYRWEEENLQCHGSTLMNAGLNLAQKIQTQPSSMLIHFVAI